MTSQKSQLKTTKTNVNEVVVPMQVVPTQMGHEQQEQGTPAAAAAAAAAAVRGGDLKLADFMELVKAELWQYDAVPLRRRFRVQGLLR